MLDALIGGPELALRYAASLRKCEKNEWCPPTWADGGAVVDLDRRQVLFFGESLMFDMNERRALMDVLSTLWTGYEICWAYDGTRELAEYVGAQLPPDPWNREPKLKLARGRNHLCHLVSVVDTDGQLRFWPLWWHLSKAWHGPALLDKLPGPGISRIKLGKIPEGGAHIDVRRKTLGAWQTADTMGFFHAPTRAVARVADRGLGGPLRGARHTVRRRVARSRGGRGRGHRQRGGADQQAGVRERRGQPGRTHRQTRRDAGTRRTRVLRQPRRPWRLRGTPDRG